MKFLIEPIAKLLDKIIPDADKRQEAKVRLAELENQGDSILYEIASKANDSMHQLNKIDAESDDKFRTRWRPAIGWICVTGLGWEMVARPFVVTAVGLITEDMATAAATIPTLDMAQIIGLVATLLGMGGLRTVEKLKGRH